MTLMVETTRDTSGNRYVRYYDDVQGDLYVVQTGSLTGASGSGSGTAITFPYALNSAPQAVMSIAEHAGTSSRTGRVSWSELVSSTGFNITQANHRTDSGAAVDVWWTAEWVGAIEYTSTDGTFQIGTANGAQFVRWKDRDGNLVRLLQVGNYGGAAHGPAITMPLAFPSMNYAVNCNGYWTIAGTDRSTCSVKKDTTQQFSCNQYEKAVAEAQPFSWRAVYIPAAGEILTTTVTNNGDHTPAPGAGTYEATQASTTGTGNYSVWDVTFAGGSSTPSSVTIREPGTGHTVGDDITLSIPALTEVSPIVVNVDSVTT